jgi:hypothetical protein
MNKTISVIALAWASAFGVGQVAAAGFVAQMAKD